MTDFLSYTRSLATSSVKIVRTAFGYALSFRPPSPSGTRISPSPETGEDALAGEWTTTTEAEASRNGTWDPLAAVMEDSGGEDASSDGDLVEEGDELVEDAGELVEDAGDWDERAVAGPPSARSRLNDAVEELRFIRLSEKATLPTRAHEGDAGLDLYASEGARIGPGQRVSVGTGLAVAIPPGLAGLVLPRSGLALKHGLSLVNSPGLIDAGYRGEVRILLLNTDGRSESRIAPGDRIAQLLLIPIATASPLEAEALDDTARGGGGFGSTGA